MEEVVVVMGEGIWEDEDEDEGEREGGVFVVPERDGEVRCWEEKGRRGFLRGGELLRMRD